MPIWSSSPKTPQAERGGAPGRIGRSSKRGWLTAPCRRESLREPFLVGAQRRQPDQVGQLVSRDHAVQPAGLRALLRQRGEELGAAWWTTRSTESA